MANTLARRAKYKYLQITVCNVRSVNAGLYIQEIKFIIHAATYRGDGNIRIGNYTFSMVL